MGQYCSVFVKIIAVHAMQVNRDLKIRLGMLEYIERVASTIFKITNNR